MEGDTVRRSSGLTPNKSRSPEAAGTRSLSLPSSTLLQTSDSRLARPPRSEQRNPSPNTSPTNFGTRLPQATSTSESRLPRSYNRRDLSDSLESPRNSLSESNSSSNWSGRSSNATTTPRASHSIQTNQINSTQSDYSPTRREVYPHSPTFPTDQFQAFHETTPSSPSFIPPFKFNSSESTFPPFTQELISSPTSISSNSIIPTSFNDLHSPRSQIPIPLPAATRNSTETRRTSLPFPSSIPVLAATLSKNSTFDSTTTHSTSTQSIPQILPQKEREEDQDSGSQYSLEGTSDSEPWGGLIVEEESPPRSPLLTRESSPMLYSTSALISNDKKNNSTIDTGNGVKEPNSLGKNVEINEELIGIDLLSKADRARTSSEDGNVRTQDWTRARSLSRSDNLVNLDQISTTIPITATSDQYSAGTADQTWWKGGGLIVNGKKLGNIERNEEEQITSRNSLSMRSESDRTASRHSGSSTPRHSIPDNPASTLRSLYTNSLQGINNTRSPPTEVLASLPSTSRSSSQSTSPTTATFPSSSSTLVDSEPRRLSHSTTTIPLRHQKTSSNDSQLGRSSPFTLKESDSTSITKSETTNPNSSPRGTLLFGNLPQPPFSFNSPSSASPRSLPSVELSNDGSAPRLVQTTQPRLSPPINPEDTLSNFVVPNFSQTSSSTITTLSPPTTTIPTPGSGKSDKKSLPVLRAKSSRRVSGGTLRRAALDSQSTIVEGREVLDDEVDNVRVEDSITTPRRDDSRELLSEFSTPLSTSDFADAYFDQSPYNADTANIYPTNSTTSSPEKEPNFRHPFRSSLDLNYPGQYPSSSSPTGRNYDNLLDPTQPNKRLSTERRTSLEATLFPTTDRKSSTDLSPSSQIYDRRPSALSEIISDDGGDIFHDASAERGSWEAQRNVPGLMELTLVGQNVTTGKGDAKARAAAFVADLRKARTEASSAASAESLITPESPVTSLFSAQAETPPTQFEEPSTSASIESIPPLAAAPDLISPPSPTISIQNSISTPTLLELPSHSSVTSFPELERLNRRRRPLPPCLLIADIKKIKAPGQRARLYATKINAIANEDSGINVWIGFVRGQYNPKPSPPHPSQQSRKNRVESSGASTFPLRQDSYQAREIPYGHFDPNQDLTPTVPYPGALPPLNSRYSNSSIKTPSVLGTKSNFFSTLGRKGSKRTPPSISQPSRAAGSYIINSPLGPLGIKSTTSSSSLRPTGPRMPQSLNTRASFESIASNATSNYQPSLGYGMRQNGGLEEEQE